MIQREQLEVIDNYKEVFFSVNFSFCLIRF